jgi:hypothetical protein
VIDHKPPSVKVGQIWIRRIEDYSTIFYYLITDIRSFVVGSVEHQNSTKCSVAITFTDEDGEERNSTMIDREFLILTLHDCELIPEDETFEFHLRYFT